MPTEIKRALNCLWCMIAIMMIEFATKAVTNFSKVSDQLSGGLAPMVFVLLIGSISFLIPSFLIVMLGKRKNWARYLFLLGFIGGTLMYFNSLYNGYSFRFIESLSALTQVILQVYALYILFGSVGSLWFKKSKV